jgi:hypothetical protein
MFLQLSMMKSSGALVCTIDNGMQKVVICGHVRASIAAAFAPVFPSEIQD